MIVQYHSLYSVSPPVQTLRDRVLATGQLLRAIYKRLEERILRTQKKELARIQDLETEKGVRDPRGLRQQKENVPDHSH